MKPKIILLVFLGTFLLCSCEKDFTEIDEITESETPDDQDSENETPDDDSIDDDKNNYSLNVDWNTNFNGHMIGDLADVGDAIWLGVDSFIVKMDKTSEETITYKRPISSAYTGLSSRAYSIAVSKKGLAWIIWSGPWPYLVTFDGENWEYPPIPSESLILDLIIDKNDEVWLSTSCGLHMYNGNGWIDYNASNSDLPYSYVSSFSVDNKNNKWLGLNPGMEISRIPLVKFDGTNFTKFTSEYLNGAGSINSIVVSSDEVIWLGTNENGLIKFDGMNWEVYNSSSSGLPDNLIRYVAIESDTVIWVITASGLTRFDGKNWNTVLQADNLLSILIDETGRKWLGTTSGLVILE